MSSVHCIVVWEWERGGLWLPHAPAVTRTLERAHAKQLTRVVLADADPALNGHCVNLRTLTQCQDMPDGSVCECAVRRSCYSVQSVGGRGARWEWARVTGPPQPAELHYEPMPMELQCLVEESACKGGGAVAWREWCVSAARGAARSPTQLRVVRRRTQPPYPLARIHAPPAPHPPARIPHQHTGSSVHSLHSTISTHSNHSNYSTQSAHSAPAAPPPVPVVRSGARSASPRDRKPGLARQILHIFSAHSKPPPAPASGEEAGSARRHSVDTVSTYLSHESKDSAPRGSVAELLDCSAGSDDVFECGLPAAPPPPRNDPSESEDDEPGGGEEVDGGWLGAAARWVVVAARPQWGAVCWQCRAHLTRDALMLRRCNHMLHAACLRALLQRNKGPARIECLVCGEVYAEEEESEDTVPPPPAPPPPSAAPMSSQPPGSMSWRLQRGPPGADGEASIIITFNFESGVQGPWAPAPGARYYAVGFPRQWAVPADALGHEVLSLVRRAWERGVLFCVRVSRTTGREHVVWCRALPPPPAAPRSPHSPRDGAPLRAARDSLLRLLANT